MNLQDWMQARLQERNGERQKVKIQKAKVKSNVSEATHRA
jgi:hypothetical protein